MQVCTQEDGYIQELMDTQTRWIADQSNGERVYQDDDRPGVEINSAWIRLGQYVKANNLAITHMRLQFRSHFINVNNGPTDKVEGFFFSKSALGSPGMARTVDYYIAGTLRNGILETRRWQIPELELDADGVQIRNVETAGECLILNQG